MRRLVFLSALFTALGFAQSCFKYGATSSLSGVLSIRDEAGYDQFTVLKLVPPVCAEADPKDVKEPSDPYYRKQTDIGEVQAAVYGSDSAAGALRDRLEQLIGFRVLIKGDLFPATTGYDRASVILRIHAIDPADASGRQALLKPKLEVQLKDVEAYDVTINAGKRLTIEAHESGSIAPLFPANKYVPHWMTGGEVLYVGCRDGYDRSLISTTEKDGGICFDGEGLCGLSAFPKKPVMIKLRCTKKR